MPKQENTQSLHAKNLDEMLKTCGEVRPLEAGGMSDPHGTAEDRGFLEQGLYSGKLDVVCNLIKNGDVSPNHVVNKEGASLLIYAIELYSDKRYADFFDFLLTRPEIECDKPLKDGTTPLMLAIIEKKIDAVQKLVKAGADLNKLLGDPEKTPLLCAIIHSSTEVLDFLLDQPSLDVNKPVKVLAKRLGERGGRKDLHVSTPPLIVAINSKDQYVVRKLIEAGADVNHSNETGTTPLINAWEMKNDEITKLILEKLTPQQILENLKSWVDNCDGFACAQKESEAAVSDVYADFGRRDMSLDEESRQGLLAVGREIHEKGWKVPQGLQRDIAEEQKPPGASSQGPEDREREWSWVRRRMAEIVVAATEGTDRTQRKS